MALGCLAWEAVAHYQLVQENAALRVERDRLAETCKE
jgi:hypothetical protein